VQTGEFGAMMQVSLTNDGPVTFWLRVPPAGTPDVAEIAKEIPMKLWSKAFADNAPIPGEFAFCVPDAASHVTLSSNRNPDLHWDDVPPATRSFVLICHDRDVPSKGDDVNQEGRGARSLPRVDFFHWVLIDIPPGLNTISAARTATA
jgi:phosphatidylethanolamine-binding protein (PEBP) family uncharacterized protein